MVPRRVASSGYHLTYLLVILKKNQKFIKNNYKMIGLVER